MTITGEPSHGWQDDIFEAWWEDIFANLPMGAKEVARLAFRLGWAAAEDR